MQVEQWQRIEKILHETLRLPDNQREEFIFDICRDDPELCQKVLNLASDSDDADDFLSHSVFSLGAQLLDEEFEVLLRNSEFGFYKLKELLGRGGVGAVFTADDTRLGREVALKILPAVLKNSDDRVLRFQQEARMASAISHPNIAHIYEFDSYNGYYYLAMEYVKGKTLRNYLKQNHPDLPLSLSIIREVTKALVAAHQIGIIHRDIKPENIMITAEENVKILDFGLAKLGHSMFDSKNSSELFKSNLITTPGLIIGTVAYMSPEQAENKQLDERTDLWSLGVLFYEMLSGKHPFLKESNIETLHSVLKEKPENSIEMGKVLPEKVYEIVQKCLAKNPNERFQTADELLIELEKIQKTEDLFNRRKSIRENKIKFLGKIKHWWNSAS
jgi:serine/threonine protein kinase